MPSDYENGAKKTIDISIKAEKMTADVLKSALQEFMSGKAEKKGRMTYKQLQATRYSTMRFRCFALIVGLTITHSRICSLQQRAIISDLRIFAETFSPQNWNYVSL